MNPQPIDELHRTKRPELSTTSNDLLERSDDKHDVERFKVGPFRLIANYQHPPIDPRSLVHTTCVVAAATAFALIVPMLLKGWLWPGRVPFLVDLSLNSVIWLIVLTPALVNAWWKLSGREREKRRLPELASAQSPLVCETRIEIRGRPSELLRFVEIRGEMFEPQVFQETHTVLGMSLQMRMMLSCALAFGASYILMRNGFQRYWWAGFTMIVFAYFVFRGIPRPPTYYRFVPGRLDFFVFSWMKSKEPIEVVQFDLRDARIRIDLTSRKHMIRLAPRGDDLDDPYKQANILEFRRDNTPSPLEFSLALVRAALSTASPPPLPMDALTG